MTSVWPFGSRRDKARLYVALYARGGPGYHWSFITGPKPETEKPESEGMRVHAIQRQRLITEHDSENTGGAASSAVPSTATTATVTNWAFEARKIHMAPTAMILVRVVIAKIEDYDRLLEILASVPMRPEDDDFSCVSWMRDCLKVLEEDTTGALSAKSKILDFDVIKPAVLEYVERKKAQHRFDGKVNVDEQVAPMWSPDRVATFDLLTGNEIFP
ncbi:hypothetical protein V8F20_006654 [Naviculisporaceae sp. PSN 640]